MKHPWVAVSGCTTVRPNLRVMDYCVHQGPRYGGMAEWFKAAVLKTVVRKYRGFESYSLRHSPYGEGKLVDSFRLALIVGHNL